MTDSVTTTQIPAPLSDEQVRKIASDVEECISNGSPEAAGLALALQLFIRPLFATLTAKDEIIAGLTGDVVAAVDKERARCADIVMAARINEVDRDFRSIHHMITSGRTVEEIKGRML